MNAAIVAHLMQIQADIKARTDESLKRAETMLDDVISQMIPAASAEIDAGESGVRQTKRKKVQA